MERPLQAFCCYAREDQLLLHPLKKHLKPLERRGLITPLQADIDISPGEDWKKKISSYLDTAQIILLLISSDFMDSDYCYGIEMKRALERQEQGEVRVIPVILRPTDWKVEPLDALQALPKNAEPVTSKFWHTLDEAFVDVAKGVQIVAEELLLQSLAEIPTVEQIQNPLEETPDTGIDYHDMAKQPYHDSVRTFSEKFIRELPVGAIDDVQSSLLLPIFQETVSTYRGSASFRGIDEFISGEKGRKKSKVFFVELGKKTNTKDRRTPPCQVSIPERMQKKKSQRWE